jgi:hypothetical protein
MTTAPLPPSRRVSADAEHRTRQPEPYVSTVRVTQGQHDGARGYFQHWLPDGRALVHLSWTVGLVAVPADSIEVVDA